MHSIKDVDGKENEIGKGASSVVVKNKAWKYVDVLFNKEIMRRNMKII